MSFVLVIQSPSMPWPQQLLNIALRSLSIKLVYRGYFTTTRVRPVIILRPPSISRDDGASPWIEVAFPVLLCRPILEWQSLSQLLHTCFVLSIFFAFLLALLSTISSILLSSASFTSSLTTVRQLDQSSAFHSQSFAFMLAALMSLWQTSL